MYFQGRRQLTTSVTVTSGSASTGATKKPATTLLAAHWPLEWIYGLLIISHLAYGCSVQYLPPHQCTLHSSQIDASHDQKCILTMTPTKEIRYVNRFPYCKANGCQKRSPHPASRNRYPVPSFKVLTETPVFSERGTSTE